jgi:hypothetical protein
LFLTFSWYFFALKIKGERGIGIESWK